MIQSLAQQIMQIYEDFNTVIAQLPDHFGIHCPPGCGTCCHSPEVESTLLEMIPLAVELWDTGAAESLLMEYATRPLPDTCLFFTPDELHFNYGRCSVYPFRPTLCRLFGFAAVRNKKGQAEFAACKFIKQMAPEAVAEVQRFVSKGGEILLFTEAAERVAALNPSFNQRMPINEALFAALQKVGMYRSFAAGESSAENPVETDPNDSPVLKHCS